MTTCIRGPWADVITVTTRSLRSHRSTFPRRCLSTSRPTYSSRPLCFHLGLSYAGKDSPPFLSVAEANARPAIGFGDETRIGRWKRAMIGLGGGRSELFASKESSEQIDIEQRRRWGAGEDFFLINQEGNSKTFIAVSDGVGGWSSSGHDPSLFSQSLMFYANEAIKSNPSIDVGKALQKGYDGTMKEKGVPCGSATACIVSMDSSTGKLSAANLGDSGYSIIRNGEVVYSAPSQTHYFNCPRQLTKLEDGMQNDGNIMDPPSVADLTQHSLQPGDVVILYTDGMADNLPFPAVLQLLKHVRATIEAPANNFLLPQEKERETARLFADVLVGYSRMLMGREDVVSPFEVAAAKEGLRYKGGKVDDITVITAIVSEDTLA